MPFLIQFKKHQAGQAAAQKQGPMQTLLSPRRVG
jgi:hypothetical protein